MILSHLTPETFPPIQCHGRLEDWSLAANMLCAPGCETQLFALLASFASPLLASVRMNEGGAMVSIYGGKKSGKTVAYDAAMSVWGEAFAPISTLLGDERFEYLGRLQTLPAFHDRLVHGDAARTQKFLEQIFLSDHVSSKKPWKGILVSFSPLPVLPVFAGGVPAGVEFEVEVPKAFIREKDKGAVAHEFTANQGHAGVRFLEWLLAVDSRREWARRQIISAMAGLREEYRLGDEARFQMRAIAAAHVAGLIVQRMGLIDFDAERVTKWARNETFSSGLSHPLRAEHQGSPEACRSAAPATASRPRAPASQKPTT